MLAGMGAKFWVIVEFSGVAGVINGLSNAYFGLWGTFFSEYNLTLDVPHNSFLTK